MQQPTQPWLTVIMPTCNSERYLRTTLDSLVVQSDQGFECLVIDGGSTDGTLAMIDGYRDRLAIRLLSRPDSTGWIDKTNLGLHEARTAFVSMLHHDDAWLPGRAAAIRMALDAHPDLDLILHPVVFIDSQDRRCGTLNSPLPALPQRIPSEFLLRRLLVQNFISVPAPTFRRERALEVGGFDPALWYTADWDFYLKLSRCCSVAYLATKLAAFRIHGHSLTILGSRNLDDFRVQMETVRDRHLGAIGDARGRRRIEALCNVSIAVNLVLAGLLHRQPVPMLATIGKTLRLGPQGWFRYLNASRIAERLFARMRAGLLAA